jgi:hypothetical protein
MTVRRISETATYRSATKPPLWFNRLTLAVLRSPLHRLADPDVCALSFRGRRSGRRIAVPVLYSVHDDALVVLVADATDKQWWRNFRQPHDIDARYGGRRRAATCRVLTASDPSYQPAAAAYERRHHVTPGPGDRMLIINPRSSECTSPTAPH